MFDQNDRPHLVVDKLRQFVNLNIHPQDKNYCSNRVCRSCVMNLDFCIQYVDRCRRINELMLQGENPDNIVATVTSHYPYLYKSDMAMMSAAPMSQNENPQTVPFQMGQFFERKDCKSDFANARSIFPSSLSMNWSLRHKFLGI